MITTLTPIETLMCSIDWHCVTDDITSDWIADDYDDTSVCLYPIISDQLVLTWTDELGFNLDAGHAFMVLW